jgi:transketolase
MRRDILYMVHMAGSGHPGGSLSCVEILATLYYDVMNIDPKHPEDPDRDRFLLSKGHAAPALYSVLARRGYFSSDSLGTLRSLGSPLQGHPHKELLPGLDCSSGSLGQGLSIANGLALAARQQGKTYRTYCLMGDGEVQEGQVWEAAMTAAHFKLDNVCAIVDDNGVQLDGPTAEIMNVEPLDEKFRAFGWHVIHVDGHDSEALNAAFQEAAATKGKPTVLIAKCVKGKGISFMENTCTWHGKAPNDQELEAALEELDQAWGLDWISAQAEEKEEDQ